MKNILVVEDESGHAELIVRALADADYTAVVVCTLAEARAEIARQTPLLALVDHNLPDGAGRELMSLAAGVFPVVTMTAHGDELLAVQAIKSGAVDYVVKSPEAFSELPHTIERALRDWNLDLERRQMQQALRESEERYRRITEGLTDYLYSVRVAEGRAVSTTHAAACVAVTGYLAEEFALDPYLWFNMIVPEDRARVTIQTQRILAGVQVPPMEHRIVRKDGVTRWVIDTPILHRDPVGGIVSYDGVVRDITERKEAEAAREHLITSLQHALANVKKLAGLLPICAGCKQIRDDKGYWNQVETYIEEHTGTRFTHGMCPDCLKKYFPEFAGSETPPGATSASP